MARFLLRRFGLALITLLFLSVLVFAASQLLPGDIGRNVLGPGVVPVLSETPGTIRSAGSVEPGQHNDEVYRELLGRSAEELDTLRAEGIV